LLTAGTFFFTQKNTEITPNTTIVNQEVEKDSALKSQPQIHENVAPIEKIQPLVQVEKSKAQPTTNNHQSTTKNKVSIIKSNQSIAHQSTTIQHNQSVNQSQKEEVIAEKQGQSNLNNDLPVIEKTIPIESKEVIAQNESKATTSSKVTVSANSLLSQVDGELDLTFREKVFKKVSKNYKEVKVAVANRNNLK
jgi:diacylglycerol kinase family enzyme